MKRRTIDEFLKAYRVTLRWPRAAPVRDRAVHQRANKDRAVDNDKEPLNRGEEIKTQHGVDNTL